MAVDRSGEARHDVSLLLNQQQLKALKRAISDSGAAARRAMRVKLKDVGEIVQTEIRSRTPVYGGKKYSGKGRLRKTRNNGKAMKHTPGLLKRSTKLKMGRLSVAIYNDAKGVSRKYPGGYRYGKRLEFDPAYGGRLAFFYPGYDAVKDKARAAFDEVLDEAVRAYGSG